MLPSSRLSGVLAHLRNPVVFGGIALIVAVALGVVVALMFAGGGDDESTSSVRVDVTRSPTPEGEDETPISGEVTGRATATITVRGGPGSGYEVLGTIPKDKEVEVIGKSEDEEWLEVYFLPPSRLSGWVSAALMEIEGSLAAIPVATPEVIERPELPTPEAPPPEPTTPPEEITPTAETSPTATPTAEMPDLVIGGAPVVGTTLNITILNQGGGELTQRVLQIGVFDARDSRLLRTVNSGPYTMAPGESIDVPTGYDIRGGPPRLLVIVDPQGVIEEADDTNNRLIFNVTVTSPTATPMPTGTPPSGLPTATPTSPAVPSPSPTPTSPS